MTTKNTIRALSIALVASGCCFGGGSESLHGVAAFFLVAIEEMLGVVDYLFAVRFEIANGVRDHRQVLL